MSPGGLASNTRPRPHLATLVGRDGDVEEVIGRLGRPGLVTLTGAPGVGKSRLAVVVADHLVGTGFPAASVVNVALLSERGAVARRVARALADARAIGSPDRAAAGPLAPVVVLDDCDHFLAECAEVAHALVGRGARVLATAREPLGVDGESVWRVRPLPLPARGQDELPDVLIESEAVQLFCDRAASAERGFIPTPETASAIADVCRRLDGIPMAIELAARLVTTYSPAEILARLDDPFILLTAGLRTAHPRHRTLSDCLAWTYDLLPPEQQDLLARLAVFPTTFDVRTAVEVCSTDALGDVAMPTMLRALVEKSFVEADTFGGLTQYRLLGPIRRFGLRRLASSGAEGAQWARYARWCTAAVEAAGDPRAGRAWLDRLKPLHDHVHAALDGPARGFDPVATVVLAEADVRLCRADGDHAAAARRLRDVVAAAASVSTIAHARALTGAGIAAHAAGDVRAATALLHESVGVADSAALRTESARARVWSAFVAVGAVGRSALPGLETAVGVARADSGPHVLVEGLVALGRARLHLGDPDPAGQTAEEALAVARRAGDEVGRAQALAVLGAAHVVLGRYGEAKGLLLEGLELATAAAEVEAAALAGVWLGEADRLQGRWVSAETWLSQAAELAAAAALPEVEARALAGVGWAAAGRSEAGAARRAFEEALRAARAASLTFLVAPCLCGLADQAGDRGSARSLVDEALAVAREWGDRAGAALALERLAGFSIAEGDLRAAAAHHAEALQLRERIGDPAASAVTLDAVAGLMAAQGEALAAARLLGAAHGLRERHGCGRPMEPGGENGPVTTSVPTALGKDAFLRAWDEGMRLSTQAAMAEAARQLGKRVARPSTGWQALTPAERTVAELVAQGRTNVQIARQLGIAPATVKTHVRRLLAKVGVDNRTALAASWHGLSQRGRSAGEHGRPPAGDRPTTPSATDVRPMDDGPDGREVRP